MKLVFEAEQRRRQEEKDEVTLKDGRATCINHFSAGVSQLLAAEAALPAVSTDIHGLSACTEISGSPVTGVRYICSLRGLLMPVPC